MNKDEKAQTYCIICSFDRIGNAYTVKILNFIRSSCPEMFRPATLLKKRLWHMCFPVNFAKFLRTLFLIEHLRLLLLIFMILTISIKLLHLLKYQIINLTMDMILLLPIFLSFLGELFSHLNIDISASGSALASASTSKYRYYKNFIPSSKLFFQK